MVTDQLQIKTLHIQRFYCICKTRNITYTLKKKNHKFTAQENIKILQSLWKKNIPFFFISEIQDQDRRPSPEKAHGVPRGCSAGRHHEGQG